MMATTTALSTDHLQHPKHQIQIPPNTNTIIDSIIISNINNNNNERSLLLVPDDDQNDVVTIAQFPTATPPVAPFTPSPNFLSGKRKRLKCKPLSIKNEKKKILTPKVKRGTSRTLSFGSKIKGSRDNVDPAEISPTMVRAGEIQTTLGNEYPSFCKTMVRSHVTSCFWMGLPMPFCRSFLPQQESTVVVEDENGEEHILKYIAYRYGLSGGWRSFAVGHNLHEGDVLIFQLVGPCKFKIYIVRTDTPGVLDSGIRLLKGREHKEQITPEIGKTESKSKRSKSTETMSNRRKKTNTKPKARTSLPLTMVQKKQKRSEPPPQLSSAVCSEVQEGSAQPTLAIQELKTFKDFHIMVNKWCIDSELSENIRLDYYNLCVAKNEILHDGVVDGVYYKLVAGMIGETVSIANMIKNCNPTTRKERFDVWDSSLKSFEIMGMKVGFLRNRVRALATLAFESEEAKRCVEAKKEKNRNLQEIRILEAKVAELYERNRKIDGFLGGLKEKVEEYEVEFQKKVNEPW